MKRLIIFLIIFSFNSVYAAWLGKKTQDTLDDFRQHTTWGFTTGANFLNYNLNLQSAIGAPDRAEPGIGAEAGLFFDFHISEPWALRFTPSVGMEHIRLYKGNDSGHLFTIAFELAIATEYSFSVKNSQFSILFGPYTHFVLASTLYGSDELRNPYSRTTASDPVTEQPSFAIGDLNAGLAFSLAYQLPSRWLIHMDLKYGVTDLLNADSHRLYVRPFKAVIAIGRRM